MPCLRIGVAIVGIEVPHCHVHLIPLNTMDDINFTKPKLQLPQDEMASLTEQIKAAV